jgi:hypothetical protein
MSRMAKIDAAVSAGGELVSALLAEGPLNHAQVRLIIEAAVRAAVLNAEEFEVRESVTRIVGELEHENQSRQM